MLGFEIDAFKFFELWQKRREEKKHFERVNRALRDCSDNEMTTHLKDLQNLLSESDNFQKPGVAYFYHKWIKNNPVLLASPTVHPLYGTLGHVVGYWSRQRRQNIMIDLAKIEW